MSTSQEEQKDASTQDSTPVAREEQEDVSTQQAGSTSEEKEIEQLMSQQRTDRWFQVITAIMLGVVALATAWSGYQATRWAGEQSTLYAQANTFRVESSRASTLAGQLRLADAISVNDWLSAYLQGNTKLANIYQRRFSPQLQVAYQAWLATNPFNNPNAPPGPLFMPEYKGSQDVLANQLDVQATNTFDKGQAAKEQGDAYVLNTVFLATVLFLTAITENFKWNRIKAVILGIAMLMLLYGIYHLIIYPII